ncbi:unnamed protein product, partial [Ectocarpus sp. 13 AM-2016]
SGLSSLSSFDTLHSPTAAPQCQSCPRLSVHPQSVSNNPIKNWSLDVSNLRKMKHLRLRGVDLDRCPEGIGHLNKLESLDFSENRIDTLDQSMAALFKLKKLGLRGNNIRVIPASLRVNFSTTW